MIFPLKRNFHDKIFEVSQGFFKRCLWDQNFRGQTKIREILRLYGILLTNNPIAKNLTRNVQTHVQSTVIRIHLSIEQCARARVIQESTEMHGFRNPGPVRVVYYM